jgi:protein phosphatase
MKPVNAEDTTEYRLASAAENQPRQGDLPGGSVDLAGLSHPGNVRPNNEDHFLVVRVERALETLLTNLSEGDVPRQFREAGYGMIVADGMGGAAAGEVASRVAISTLIKLVINTSDWIMRFGEPEAQEVMQRMADRYRQIDAVLRGQAWDDPSLAGMGTTMTLAASVGRNLVLAHIGDSRAYLLRRGRLYQLTQDQTMAQTLADQGIIRPEDKASHWLRHVLTSALGGGNSKAKPEVRSIGLARDDQVLLCTDGLTEHVDDPTIAQVLQSAASADEACRSLLQLALTNGGKDNVTIVVARYQFPKDN